ncbi:MAG: redoxin domain-containing protein [Sphingobacteriaceae bacterium]|nr:redoxin domain-containing protein [Sphingobacteriaceae bacterium]
MRHLIIIFFIVSSCKRVYSFQENEPKKAIIEIESSNATSLDSISVIYRDNFWSSVGGIIKIDAKVVSTGIYQVDFRNNEPVAYFTVLNRKMGRQDFLLYQCLIQPDDYIKINLLKDGKIEFSGRGSAKLNCVLNVQDAIKVWETKRADSLNTLYSSEKVKRPLQNLSYFKTQLLSSNQRLTSCKKIITTILEKYKNELSNDIIELIKCNIFGDLETENHRVFAFYYSKLSKLNGDKSSHEFQEFKAVYYNRSKIDFSVFPNKILLLSGGYQQFVVQLTTNRDLLGENGFNYINDRYNGELKDRLLTSFLLWSFSNSSNNAKYIQDAVKSVKTSYCKSILANLDNAVTVGKQSFQFELTDSTGNIINQKDFLGKVVLLDFYFTGCTGCRGLNEKMLNIYNHFKSNKNIVFVSVSIDKNFDNWKAGIKKQLYSHKGSIDLYTNGLGDRAPIIEHYKISAYPTLILIDKKGQIISSNPPKPYDITKEKELFDILQKAVDM